MRAALLEAPGQDMAVVDDIDVDEVRPLQVRVRVTHCGVCHSDLHLLDGSIPCALPAILGHEAAGVVEEIGAGVTHLAPGDKVVLSARPFCGACYWCVRGEVQLCARATELFTGMRADFTTGLSRAGQMVFIGVGLAAFGEIVVTQATGAVKVPDDTPLDVAAVIGCAIQTGVGAVVNTAKVEEGATVLIVGLGGIGVALAQGARLAGASKIIGVDPLPARREQALAFGVTDTVDPTEVDLLAAGMDLTDGIGVDYAFEAVGRVELIEACFAALRNGGTAVAVGVPNIESVISLPGIGFLSEKRLIGTLLGSANSMREIPRLLDLWRAGRLDLEGMVTARRPLADINLAFDDMKAGIGLRTVIEMPA
ncbi:MAG: S-(hydroxymethyl)glutathione dehydrogenase / alcohol dehydrogenase [Acidimicrobiaceae bacterium]|jgi:Zn-dependent alcohol dehydrogenase